MFRPSTIQVDGIKNYIPIAQRFFFYFFLLFQTCRGESSSTWFVLNTAAAIPLQLFRYCFSRAAAIPLFALQTFGNFWWFLFWFLLKKLSFNMTDVPVSVVGTIRSHAIYPLQILISLDGGFWTHSLDRTRSAINTATYRLSIAHSH